MMKNYCIGYFRVEVKDDSSKLNPNSTVFKPYVFTFIFEDEEKTKIRRIIDLESYLIDGTGVSDIELLGDIDGTDFSCYEIGGKNTFGFKDVQLIAKSF